MNVYWQHFRKGDRHPNNPFFAADFDMWIAFDKDDKPIGSFWRCADNSDRWGLTWHPEKKPPRLLPANLTIVEVKDEFLKWRLNVATNR